GELWVADSVAVGQNGTGVMTMTGGWIAQTGFFTVGNNPGANGTFNMSAGRVDMTFGDFEVGDEAVGNVTISGAALVNTDAMIVGRNATNLSTLNVNGGTIKINNDFNGNNGDLFVGLE